MELKLTRTAAEILNDILLNTLQQYGLAKMEALEQIFFDEFDELLTTADGKNNAASTAVVDEYTFFYKHGKSVIFLVAIIHSSRLPEMLKD